MIVVSDSSPLLYLTLIGVSQYLPRLYESIYIPKAVYAELQHDQSPIKEWISPPPDWLTVACATNLIPSASLDRGEREAISLAIELKADVLLVDERTGRSAAQDLGLRVAGTLGVIMDGHNRRLLDGYKALDDLARTTFYASPALLSAIRSKLRP